MPSVTPLCVRFRAGVGPAKNRDRPKSADLHLDLPRDQDVLGLDVAVNDPLVVGVLEREGDLPDHAEGDGQVRRPLAREVVAEVPPLDVFEDHVSLAVVLAELVDVDDVRVVQFRDGLGLGLEPLQGGGVGRELVAEQLQRDFPLERELAGEVDLPHAAGAEPAEELVVAERAAGEIGRRRGRRCRVSAVEGWGIASGIGPAPGGFLTRTIPGRDAAAGGCRYLTAPRGKGK